MKSVDTSSSLYPIRRIPSLFLEYLPFVILAALFAFLVKESFVLSEGWDVLSLREVDDFAMQASVRREQIAILAGHWRQVFSCFDYAYGNVHWIFSSLVLFPFYFLGSAQATIVAGRVLSLCLGFLCLWVIAKIIDLFCKDRIIRNWILVYIASFPVFGLWVQRLHVNFQYSFFGLLSLYILLREPILTKRGLRTSALLCGLSIGFKLTAAFLLPLICLSLLWRVPQRSFKALFKSVSIYLSIVFVAALFFSDPWLAVHFWDPSSWKNFFATVADFKQRGKTDPSVTPLLLLNTGIFQNYLSLFTSLVVVVSSFLMLRQPRQDKRFFGLGLLINIVIVVVLNTCVVVKGADYTAAYSMGVLLLLPLGLIGVESLSWPSEIKGFFLAGLVLFEILGPGWSARKVIFSRYFIFERSAQAQAQLKALKEMRKVVPSAGSGLSVIRDLTTVFPLTIFEPGVEERVNFWNLEETKMIPFDYVVFNTDYWIPKNLLDGKGSSADVEEAKRELNNRKRLEETGWLFGRKYRLLYSGNNVELFKKIN